MEVLAQEVARAGDVVHEREIRIDIYHRQPVIVLCICGPSHGISYMLKIEPSRASMKGYQRIRQA